MPNYGATQQRIVSENDFGVRPSPIGPVPPLARLLAEFHTSMNMVGLRYFDGNMDRFVVFCLLLRTSLSHPEHDGRISVHSAAMSLGRPFETVRRHICALLDRGVCERNAVGVGLSRPYWERPQNWRQMRYAQDCFIRLVADGVAAGMIPVTSPVDVETRKFSLSDGVCAAVDLFLALADANQHLCAEPIDLAIFSAILHSNQQAYEADRAAGIGSDALLPRHAVRVAQVARALSIPDTTVRRRVAPRSGEGGLYVRTSAGLLIATDRFCTHDSCGQAGTARHGSIRLIIQRAVAAGLSLHRPSQHYCEGRPPAPVIA